ncbi:DUF6221 family protein [Geodermatophilus chilensis]|jgi:hypothetical protein|uniref:DUF6221 family protein n=1 Tax=Geodermatophilus chilensis TaxID=2035835 RepID=UPI000C25A17A|nr:DUF6221 family protein [Geodermatophilus chilensis]
MDADPGLEPDLEPDLDGFLLARIAEDQRLAAEAAQATGRKSWDGGVTAPPGATDHVAHHDPARVLADCAARRRLVLACRDVRPDLRLLGARPEGLDFPLAPTDAHQLAALTLALLALPHAAHPDYRPVWRP